MTTVQREPFPDYAKSSHPAVLEALRETTRRREAFLAQMREVSTKYTGEAGNGYFRGWHFDGQHMTGLGARGYDTDALPGQWKKPDGGVLVPYKNNPATADFNISYKAASIPGRNNVEMGHGRMGTGTLFEFDGVVYSHYGFSRDAMSEKEKTAAAEFGWVEIMASEFHRALESENARRAGKQVPA